jgi:hypothetical protein
MLYIIFSLFAVVAVVAFTVYRPVGKDPESKSFAAQWNSIRPYGQLVSVLVALMCITATSYVSVPDGMTAHLFKIYGFSQLKDGRIIAANGEKGPQAEILPPGFHIRLFINVIYNVEFQTDHRGSTRAMR